MEQPLQDFGKLQLHDAISAILFSLHDIGSDPFRVAFHGLRRDLQASEQVRFSVPCAETVFPAKLVMRLISGEHSVPATSNS